MSQRFFRLSLLSIAVLSCVLRYLVAPNVLFDATFDDRLMVFQANSIINGNWLGNYDVLGHITLSKPPGYALFLSLIEPTPLSPTDAVHLLLIAGLLLVVRELRLLSFQRRTCLIFFVAVSFYPVWFNEPISRIYRDGLLAALTMLIIWLALNIARHTSNISHQFNRHIIHFLLSILFMGLLIGYWIITKNTWHFLLPIIVGAILIGLRKNENKRLHKRSIYIVVLSSSLLLLLASQVFPQYVKHQNRQNYGVSLIDNYAYGNFPEALKVMYSVEDARNRPYVDITADMRAQMYQVSPTFNSLKQFLEIPAGMGWKGTSCSSPLAICDESSSWFPWDLRDAIQQAGLGQTPIQFETTLKNIRNEIQNACRAKAIKCGSKGLAPGLDSLDSLSLRAVLNATSYGLVAVINPDLGRSERILETRDADLKSRSIWYETINRVPKSLPETKSEARSVSLYDVRSLLNVFYKPTLYIVVVVALIGFLAHLRSRNETWWWGFVLLSAALIHILEVALVEASSGMYMIPGAELYLIPVVPLFLLFIFLGCDLFTKAASKYLVLRQSLPVSPQELSAE